MSDYFDDPGNFEPVGPPRRRSRPGLTEHVPIRFKPWTIARVRILAERDRKPVSSWIRDVVEAEVERRLPQHAETATTPGTFELDEWLRGSPRGTVANESEGEFAFP